MFGVFSCSGSGASNSPQDQDESKKTYTEFRREELAKEAGERKKLIDKKEKKKLKKESDSGKK